MPSEQLPPTLTVSEACALTRATRKTVMRWVREKQFPAPRRIGGKILWDRDTVLRFLADPTVPVDAPATV